MQHRADVVEGAALQQGGQFVRVDEAVDAQRREVALLQRVAREVGHPDALGAARVEAVHQRAADEAGAAGDEDRLVHQPRTCANISGATIVASDSTMNLGVSMASFSQVIFSLGEAPEYEP